QAGRILPGERDDVRPQLFGQARRAIRDAGAVRKEGTEDGDASPGHAADRKFTTVEAKYAPHVRASKTSDDDMKQECVQWHSFALIDFRCASASGENQSLPKS